MKKTGDGTPSWADVGKAPAKRNKYGNHKVYYRGIPFDSELERDRYIFLKAAEREGKISCVKHQVWFTLIPRQDGTKMKIMPSGKVKEVKCVLEHAVHYIADFVYTKKGVEVVEDTKGHKTHDYLIKRKLMRLKGYPIREVRRPGEEI